MFKNAKQVILKRQDTSCCDQETIKGTEKAPPYTPYFIGNSSRVIFRIGIKLPRALRGCFVEVSHD